MNASSRINSVRIGQIFAGALFAVAVIAPGAYAQDYVPDGKSLPLVTSDGGTVTPLPAADSSRPVVTASPASNPASTSDPAPAAAPAVDPGDVSTPKSAVVKGVTLQATDPAFTGANTGLLVTLGALALGGGIALRVAARKRA